MKEIEIDIIDREEIGFNVDNSVVKVYPNLENLEITPSKEEQTFKSENYYGYDEVKVNGVTNEIDENIVPENIKEGVEVLGITGTYNNAKEEQEVNIVPDFSNGNFEILPDDSKALNKVVLEKDIDLEPNNIKKDVEIFGVTGNLEGEDINEYFASSVTNETNAYAIIKKYPDEFYVSIGGRTSYNSFLQGHVYLEEIKSFDTSRATNMSYMLNACHHLKNIPSLDTSNVTNFSYAFNCSRIERMELIDCGKATNIRTIIGTYNNNLIYLGGFKDLGKSYPTTATANGASYSLDIQCKNLSTESAINVLNNLYDIASRGVNPQSVKFGANVVANLEAIEEGRTAIANAQNKGWTVL